MAYRPGSYHDLNPIGSCVGVLALGFSFWESFPWAISFQSEEVAIQSCTEGRAG